MAWDDIHGQDLVKRIWAAHLASGEIAQAYLLSGSVGVGKRLLVGEMAKALSCGAEGSRPCDACVSCAQVTKQIHPDVHWLTPEGPAELIKIESVRRMLGRIALRPYHGRFHVIIIDGAERLTEEAANSLLKSLEEPPGRTCFLLTTAQVSRCLPTVVSRCQLIPCQRLASEVIETILRSRQVCDAAAAPVITRLAEGSASRALELAARWPAYQQLLDLCGTEQPLTWLATPLPETRDEVQRFLEGMTVWLRDVAVVAEADPAWAANRMADAPLRRAAARCDLDRCLETAFELISLRDSLEQFVSPRLVASLAREQWLALHEAGHG